MDSMHLKGKCPCVTDISDHGGVTVVDERVAWDTCIDCISLIVDAGFVFSLWVEMHAIFDVVLLSDRTKPIAVLPFRVF